MSTHADSKPWTVPALAEAKRNGQKLVMLTAYDAGFARTFDANGVDLILIGDSLGMVVQGHDSTLPVTVADMVYHTRAVAACCSVRCWWRTCPSAPMPPARAGCLAAAAAGRCRDGQDRRCRLQGRHHPLPGRARDSGLRTWA